MKASNLIIVSVVFVSSISCLCWLGPRVGVHSGILLCTNVWTLKRAGFHRNLFLDGFSLGKDLYSTSFFRDIS